MPNKKISQLDVRSSPTLADLLAIADPSTGYAYKITGTNLQTVLEIPNKVPYTGATANVNLGAYSITATNIIRAGGLATQFLKADGSVDSTTYMNRAVYDTDGNGVVDAAEKMQTIGRNSTGVTLYKGTIVYISGSTGNRPNFVKAQANSEATSAGTFGVVVSDIANNSDGYVATIGTLADLDTRTTATNPFTSVTLADGDTLYLDPNTAGYVTNVKPSAPNHIVYVGKVVRTSPTLGTIVYRIQNGYELSEIHDVSISSVANNDVLVYEIATTLWKNKSIATILGYTPQATITLTTTGNSGASTFVSNTLNIPTYTLAGLGGQAQLNGTGFVKALGTTISYDNTTYAADSLVVHLAGAENITGVKTFQNALQTTTGNNLLNTGGGNTVIGYTADPASSATYKLDVNGGVKMYGVHLIQSGVGGGNTFLTIKNQAGTNIAVLDNGGGLNFSGNATFTNTIGFNGKIGSNATGGIAIVPGGVPSSLNDSQIMLLVSAPLVDYTSTYGLNEQGIFLGGTYNGGQGPTRMILGPSRYYNAGGTATSQWNFTIQSASGQVTDGYGSNLILAGGQGRGTGTPGKFIVQTSTATTTGTTLQTLSNRLEVDGTGQLKLNGYTSTSVFTGTVAGLLGFDSSGNVITSAAGVTGSGTAGQITYWSGTSAVTGSSNLFWDNTNGRLGIGTSSPAYKLDITNNVDSGTEALRVTNANTGTSATAGISVQSSGAYGALFATSTTYSSIPILGASTIGFYVTKTFSIVIADASSSFRIISGSTLTEKLRLFNGGNLLIQNGGTFTDGGQRLQVIGSMRVGTTAASSMYWDDTNNRLVIGNTSYTDSALSKFVLGTSSSSGASRLSIATAQSYMDISFIKTGATANTHNSWSFGQRFDTYFGNESGSFQLVGGYTSDTGTGGTYTLRVPIIANPNGDVLINGASANAFSRYIGLGVNAPTALTDIGASTTTRSSLRIRSGIAPTSPNDGDIWYDGTNIYIRVGTTTKTFTIL